MRNITRNTKKANVRITDKEVAWSCLQVIINAVFNNFNGLKLYGITSNANDTVFTYILKTDAKLTKQMQNNLNYFVLGIIAATS